jgi:hypothetical protein
MSNTQRKKVSKRTVGRNRYGAIVLMRVTYADGRKTWNVSNGGVLTLCGNDKGLVRSLLS